MRVDEKRRASETGDEAQAIPFLKRFTVFNTDQRDGLPWEIATTAPPSPPGLIEPQVEYLIRASGIDFRIGGNSHAPNNATLSFDLALANRGRLTYKAVAESLGLPSSSIEQAAA